MPNKEDETKVLYQLEDLQANDVSNNEILEVEEEAPQKEQRPDFDFFMKPPEEPKRGKKNIFLKLKEWWNKRNKKQKILLMSGVLFLFLLLILGVFFLLKNKKEETLQEEKPEDIIVLKENYRYENGILVFLNEKKEEIGRYTCKNQDENLCFVSFYSEEDDFDSLKKLNEKGEKITTRSSILSNRYVFLNDTNELENSLIYLYDLKNEQELGTYQLVKAVDGEEGLVILKNKEGKYGLVSYLNNQEDIKINFLFDYLGYVKNENRIFVSVQNGRTVLVNENGQNISKTLPGTVKNLNANYIKVKTNTDQYEVYNYNAKNIFGESFDYVELYSDYAALIRDNTLFLKYYDQNKLNEKGISLTNRNYVPTQIYDEENKLKETLSSFSLEENGDLITIEITKKDTKDKISISKLEAEVSKSLKQMNYFDGNLYFYKDSAKKELLGSYSCANKNTLTQESKSLKECTLAKDTIFEENDYEINKSVGIIPIFNERFVFILDEPALVNDGNKTVVLYDLKKGSVLGKYAEVNTYTYTGTEEINFQNTNSLAVVLKNKNGKFGVIKLGQEEVSGHIGFNYSSMESLRDYYVAQDANGYLLLDKKNGASVTSAISYKIRDYNEMAKMVKIKNNDKYFVYSYQNGPLKMHAEKGYKYIELYDLFFAAVTEENQLEIYLYDKPDKNVLTQVVELKLNHFYGEGTKAFKITKEMQNYTICIGLDTNNTYNCETTFTLNEGMNQE